MLRQGDLKHCSIFGLDCGGISSRKSKTLARTCTMRIHCQLVVEDSSQMLPSCLIEHHGYLLFAKFTRHAWNDGSRGWRGKRRPAVQAYFLPLCSSTRRKLAAAMSAETGA